MRIFQKFLNGAFEIPPKKYLRFDQFIISNKFFSVKVYKFYKISLIGKRFKLDIDLNLEKKYRLKKRN